MFEAFKGARRITDLEGRVETLERNLKGLQMEWSDVLDRMVRMKQRIMKAERDAAARGDTPDTEKTHLSDEDIAGGATSLTERQRAAQERILALRRTRTQ
jgi:hypothetical protein